MTHIRSVLYAFTYKEGLFSRVAHDLQHELRKFSVQAHDGAITARFELSSLEPLGAVRAGKLDSTALSASDVAQIRRATQKEVLQTDRHPYATFDGRYEADGERVRVKGRLALHGQSRELEFEARAAGDLVVGALDLRPSEFGVAPYRALLGALRLQDRVRIEFSLVRAELSERGSV